MPYISNTKIDYKFISPFFQYTQLQYFCPQILQQCAGYSTSYLFICSAHSDHMHAYPSSLSVFAEDGGGPN